MSFLRIVARAGAVSAALLAVIPADLRAAPAGWSPTFSDEFDGSSLNTTNWRAWQPSTPGPYNEERQEYLPSQVAVTGGNLVITAVNQPYTSQYGSYQYRSGRVESNFEQQYGRFEFRADLPGTKGTWPALWLLPDVRDYNWPTQGEIDVLENRGHQPTLTSSAFHFRNPANGQHAYVAEDRTSARFGQIENYHDSFHTYAVEWDGTKIRYFVDDVHWYTTYNQGGYAGEGGVTTGGFIGNQSAPMQLVMNVAVGGQFLGAGNQPDATSVWPQQMLVDYVRVFERNDDPFVLNNGAFEANDGSLAHWSVYGNRTNTNNVSVHNEAAHGEASLKLFGQFAGGTTQSGASQGITVAPGDEVKAIASRFIRSQDSIAGTNNSVQMRVEFFSEFGGRTPIAGAPAPLVIANSASANDAWDEFELSAVAPAAAVEARVTFNFTQMANGGGAVHIDDVSFVNERLAATADFNLDGVVDGDDLAILQNGFGMDSGAARANGDATGDGLVDGADVLAWQVQSNHEGQSASPAAATIPEPAGASVLWSAALTLLGGRKLAFAR